MKALCYCCLLLAGLLLSASPAQGTDRLLASPVLGTWVGKGYEASDAKEFFYTSRLLVDQPPTSDTLYCSIFLQALNGNRLTQTFRFKALLRNNTLLALNSTFVPSGTSGDKSLRVVGAGGTQLAGIFYSFNEEGQEIALYLKYTRRSALTEKAVTDPDRFTECYQAQTQRVSEDKFAQQLPGDRFFNRVATPCIIGQLNFASARYEFLPAIQLLTITVDGLTPIDLVLDAATGARFMQQRAATRFQLEEAKMLVFDERQLALMFQPVALTIENPAVPGGLSFPQASPPRVSFRPLFQDLIDLGRKTPEAIRKIKKE